ncbi:MAG: phosphotransferase enzyme family protein [Isosphaeraceae bacterium]
MAQGSISSLLSHYPAWAQPISAVSPLGNAGGLSGSAIWRYSAAVGELAIRAWPPGVTSLAHVLTIHGWLREASDPDRLPIPVPLPALDGQTACELDGRCWEIAPWMPGAPDLGRPPSEVRVRAAFAALAQLHGRLSHHQRMVTSPGLRIRVSELEHFAGIGFDRLQSALAKCPDDERVADARRWLGLARWALPGILPAAREAASRVVPVQPCLRDARPDHFLFEANRLTGLIDFGAMGFETVAADLARLLGEWLADFEQLRALGLAAYEQVRPLAPDERALLNPFEAIADLLLAGHWITWHFLDQRTFAAPGAVGQGIARGLARLERLANRLSITKLQS